MKILLTSDRWKSDEKIKEKFVKTLKEVKDKNVILITIAKKNSEEWKHVKYHINELRKIGIKKENIKIISLKERKVKWPEKIDVVYVRGGNTFHYMKELRRLKLTRKIRELGKKEIIYFGISAGSIIAGKRIDIAKIGKCKDVKDVKIKNYSGLKLVNFVIFPHYTEEDEKEIRKFEKEKKCKIVRLRDGDLVII
jgi:peptidase E